MKVENGKAGAIAVLKDRGAAEFALGSEEEWSSPRDRNTRTGLRNESRCGRAPEPVHLRLSKYSSPGNVSPGHTLRDLSWVRP